MATSPLPLPVSIVRRVTAESAVPLLALGGGLTLIGAMRSLGPGKVPLFTLCEEKDLAMRSRWYRDLPMSLNTNPDDLAAMLRWLPWEKAVLVPCSDEWLRAVSRLPKHLADQFPSSIASASVVDTMTDKWRFAQLLRRVGTPHPETLLIDSYEQIKRTPAEQLVGKVLKPLFSPEFGRKHGVKGFVIREKSQALHFGEQIDYPILLQQYIPGPPTANIFIDGFADRNGQVCARFARRRLRMYPPRLGNSSFLVSIALNDVEPAVQALDRLLSSVLYRGIFSAEFKYDMRDSRFKILEVNARPWWFVEFASHCGVNVCKMAYDDALGLPVRPVTRYAVGKKCILLPSDFGAFRYHSDLGFWSWVRSWAGSHGSLFTWNDPVPAVTYCWRVVARSFKRRLGKGEKLHALPLDRNVSVA